MKSIYPIKVEHLLQHNGGPMVCHGCAHSAGAAAYPGHPSGERPCCFCVRNVQREEWILAMPQEQRDQYGKTWTAYYNNQAMKKCPMDCYISTDRIMDTVPEGAHIIT